jgi:lysyl oxidase
VSGPVRGVAGLEVPVRRCALLIMPVVGLMLLATAQPAAAATPGLPDLAMAPLADLSVDNTADGRALLRFSTTIVNIGTGRFELSASRPDTSAAFKVRQRLYDADGSADERRTSAKLIFAGDGHTHWHVRNLESYELSSTGDGAKVGTSAKAGFCFSDDVRYRPSLAGAPASAQYHRPQCGTPSSLSLVMGLSVGWGDRYGSKLPDQYIDITGLADGAYRLRATADASNWFKESNEKNNRTWVDLTLKHVRGKVTAKVDGYPSAA